MLNKHRSHTLAIAVDKISVIDGLSEPSGFLGDDRQE
jgi:hypothetical protein